VVVGYDACLAADITASLSGVVCQCKTVLKISSEIKLEVAIKVLNCYYQKTTLLIWNRIYKFAVARSIVRFKRDVETPLSDSSSVAPEAATDALDVIMTTIASTQLQSSTWPQQTTAVSLNQSHTRRPAATGGDPRRGHKPVRGLGNDVITNSFSS
jgi:hypothetical protein